MDKEHRQMKDIAGNMDIFPAPEGFTSRVMNRVLAESRSNPVTYQPLISPAAWFIIFVSFIALAILVYFISGNTGETGTIYGYHITLEPVFIWMREVFAFIRTVNVSPQLIYLSVVALLSLLLIDEFILKSIWQRR